MWETGEYGEHDVSSLQADDAARGAQRRQHILVRHVRPVAAVPTAAMDRAVLDHQGRRELMEAMLLLVGDDGTPERVLTVRRCDAQDHEPRLAAYRVHWPTGPGDFCAACAMRLLEIGRVMGVHVHTEPIDPPDVPTLRRAIALTGMRPS